MVFQVLVLSPCPGSLGLEKLNLLTVESHCLVLSPCLGSQGLEQLDLLTVESYCLSGESMSREAGTRAVESADNLIVWC